MITEMVIMFLLLDDGFYRPLLSRELTFGLKPILQFTARLCPASEIKFVGASPERAHPRPREGQSCRVIWVLPLPARWAKFHEPPAGSRRGPSRPGPHPEVGTRSRRPVVSSSLPAVARC